MKRSFLQRWMIVVLALALLLLAAGCATADKKDDSSDPAPAEEPLYPVTLNGVTVLVGETKVQALLDAGMEITWSEMTEDNQINEFVVDPSLQLDPDTYYTGASVWLNEHVFAHIAFVTEERSVRLGEAIIARLEIHFSYDEAANADANVSFNGVPATELTREKAGEMFPDFTGDDNMWFSSGLREYDYGIYYANGTISSLSVEREYDVDWNSGN